MTEVMVITYFFAMTVSVTSQKYILHIGCNQELNLLRLGALHELICRGAPSFHCLAIMLKLFAKDSDSPVVIILSAGLRTCNLSHLSQSF